MSKLEDRLDKLNEYLQEQMTDIESKIAIDSKTLDQALKEQLPLQLEWERIVSLLSITHSHVKQQVEHQFAMAFTKAGANSYANISTTEAKYHASCDTDYQKYKSLENKANNLKERAEGILKTIESRKYVLKDLCAAVINGVEKNII